MSQVSKNAGNFLQADVFIDNSWKSPEQILELEADQQFLYLDYEITIKPYTAFHCGLILPDAHSEVESETAEPEQPSETKTEIETATEGGIEQQKQEKNEEKDEQVASKAYQVSGAIKEMIHSPINKSGENYLFSLPIFAKDILQKDVLWGSPQDSVEQTILKMRKKKASHLLVGSEGKADGIVSCLDIAEAVSIYLKPVFSKWRRTADDATLQIKIKWIMTDDIRTIPEDTHITEIMENLCRFGGQCLPVTNADGKIEGIVTTFDVLRALLDFQITPVAEKTENTTEQ